MKKYFLSIICILFSVINCFALDKCYIKVQQYVQPPKCSYYELPSPSMPVGSYSLKYSLSIPAGDSENEKVACSIKYPKDLKLKYSASSGTTSFNFKEDGKTPEFSEYTEGDSNYFEFLTQPRETAGEGFVEFKVDIPESYAGKRIPIEFNFEYLKKPFLSRHRTGLSIAAGVATGIIVGVVTFNPAVGFASGTSAAATIAGGATTIGAIGAVAAGGVAAVAAGAGTNYIVIDITSFHEKKKEYSPDKLNNSYKRFTLYIDDSTLKNKNISHEDYCKSVFNAD